VRGYRFRSFDVLPTSTARIDDYERPWLTTIRLYADIGRTLELAKNATVY